MKKIIKLKSLLILSALLLNLGSLEAQDLNRYFDVGACDGVPMTRQEAMSHLGPAATSRVLTESYQSYLRTRRCYPELGCQDWYVVDVKDLQCREGFAGHCYFTAGQSHTLHYALLLDQSIYIKYEANNPYVSIQHRGISDAAGHKLWDKKQIQGMVHNTSESMTLPMFFNNSKIEAMSFTPATPVTNRVSKLTNSCYWNKVIGSEQKTDSSGNSYRYDAELVVHAAF